MTRSTAESGATHEPAHHADEIVIPSNRSFGLLFTVVFTIVALLPLWSGRPLRAWALAVALAFGITALARPALLGPLSRLWQRLGLAMHYVVNPVVMAALFYLVVTPFGIGMRLLGKGRSRRMRPDPSATTYWIDRAGQPPSRMDQQF